MKSTGTLNHKKEAWQSAYDFSLEIMINNGEKADCRGRWSSLAKTGGILSLRAPDAKSTETLNHKKGVWQSDCDSFCIGVTIQKREKTLCHSASGIAMKSSFR